MSRVARLFAVLAISIVVIAPLTDSTSVRAATSSGGPHAASNVKLSTKDHSPLTTAWTAANCSVDASDVQQFVGGQIELSQALNGDLSGCFRVPSLRTSRLVIALQAYADRTLPATTAAITNVSTSESDGDFALSASSHNVSPGEKLNLFVHYAGARPSPIDDYPDLCWDGCQSGLTEQSTSLHWINHSEFRVTFTVPDSAWFESHGKKAFIHPLTTGDYSIGIECITVTSGCATEPADAQVVVHLINQRPVRCVASTKCAFLKFSASAAQVGDVISVHGWAPVPSIIGTPFGLSLTVTRANKNQSYAPFSATAPSPEEFNLVMARRAFAVRPDTPWADLGRLRTLSSTWSGVWPISPSVGSPLIAWCRSTDIEVTGGASVERIPTSGVPLAIRGTHFKNPGPAQPDPQCSSVMLDPRASSTVYAGFSYALNGEAPPENLVGLYTLNSGATWNLVPAPPGLNVEDFAGFTTDTRGVAALFATPYVDNGINAGVTLRDEVTADGGRTWSPSTLSCPATGPCVNFGPTELGNCAMNGTGQPFLEGSPSTSTTPVRWSSTSWVTLVNTCFSQQLVTSSARDELLLDPSSPYPLLRSVDGGTTWSNIDLPAISGSTLGSDDPTDVNSLLLVPDGTLFASLSNTAGTKQRLYRLDPGGASWCVVPKVFGTSNAVGTPGPLRSSGNNVAWIETVYNGNAAKQPMSLHLRSVSSLHC